MSVIAAVKTYIATYAGLTTGAPLWVDYLGPQVNGYAIVPVAGNKITARYLDGGSLREFPFALRSMVSTSDELERLDNAGFSEAFADWLESQTEAGVLPTITGTPTRTAETIEATGWGYLYEQGISATGVYQVTCRLTYSQAAP
jgi:hypothetical protein